MRELIEQYLNAYIETNNLKLTDEQYEHAYNGVEYWLTSALPEAAGDSVKNAL